MTEIVPDIDVDTPLSCTCTFCDTPERQGVLDAVKECKTTEDALVRLNEFYPDWITYSFPGYSADYPSLSKNWMHICKKLGVEKKAILLVKSIIFDDQHSILCRICEIMTQFGCVVRRVGEFVPCEKCGLAIPHIELHRNLKAQSLPVPRKYTEKCTRC